MPSLPLHSIPLQTGKDGMLLEKQNNRQPPLRFGLHPSSPKNPDVPGHANCTASFLRLPNAKFLDHPHHFRHNHPASVAALRLPDRNPQEC